MSWITPKTNWSSTDYYNLEDAQRIAGNICHLKDLVAEHYGDQELDCLTYRKGRYVSFYPADADDCWKYFGLNKINPTQIGVISPSQYSRDTVDWINKDTDNLIALSKLIMLTFEKEPKYRESGLVQSGNREINYYYGIGWDADVYTKPARYPYAGTCISNIAAPSPNTDYTETPFMALWGYNDSYLNRLPIKVQWQSYNSQAIMEISNDSYNLYNTYFYNATTLNMIENKTLQVYNKIIQYWGEES